MGWGKQSWLTMFEIPAISRLYRHVGTFLLDSVEGLYNLRTGVNMLKPTHPTFLEWAFIVIMWLVLLFQSCIRMRFSDSITPQKRKYFRCALLTAIVLICSKLGRSDIRGTLDFHTDTKFVHLQVLNKALFGLRLESLALPMLLPTPPLQANGWTPDLQALWTQWTRDLQALWTQWTRDLQAWWTQFRGAEKELIMPWILNGMLRIWEAVKAQPL